VISSIPFARGYDPDADGDEVDQTLIDEAVAIACRPGVDVVVVNVGLPEIAESEGFDRDHIRLPGQHIALVEALIQNHKNVVVVLSHGGIVEIPSSFAEGAKAILDAFLLGQAGGHALVDVLFGEVSPSGKLPETIPVSAGRGVIPSGECFPGNKEKVEYREGLDVGYRYFDTAKTPVRFPFGHGLQYTEFLYGNLDVDVRRDEEAAKRVRVSLDVTNTGGTTTGGTPPSFSKPAMEVVQLYVRPIGSTVYRPYHELKGFSKVELSPGETKRVDFELDERSFSYYDIGWKDWVVEESSSPSSGFEIRVGASSRDIRLNESVRFRTGRMPSELARLSYPPVTENQGNNNSSSSNNGGSLVASDEVFAKRLALETARSPADNNNNSNTKDTITRNTLVVDAARDSFLASILFCVSWLVAKQEVRPGPTKKRELRMIRANIENIPLRSLVVFSQGILTFRMLDAMITVMNLKLKQKTKDFFCLGKRG